MTAAPESDRDDSGKANLLRDIGRSNSLRAGAGGAEDELMRAAHDPLLVRRMVLRDVPGGSPGWSKPVRPAIGLRAAAEGRGIPPSAAVSAACRYEVPAGRLEPSLSPTAFAPAPEDREAALDHDFGHRPASSRRGFPRSLFWLGLGSVVVIGFILLPG